MYEEIFCSKCERYGIGKNKCEGCPEVHGCVTDDVLEKLTVNFSSEPVKIDKNKKSIFLAGPTRRNSTYEESWRRDAVSMLEAAGFEGIIYVPERKKDFEYDYINQVEWEREALMAANTILFYIPRHLPDMPGFTTNVEFGMYLAKRPDAVMFCSPEDAEKNRYLEWLYLTEKPESKIYRELNDAITDCV